MSEPEALQRIRSHLRRGGHLTLFLDYDGTLVDIIPGHAPSPEASLVRLLTDLAHRPAIQTIILSGRTLQSLRAVLPVPGLTLAGVYGIEVQQPDGGRLDRAPLAEIRPIVEQVRSEWARLIEGRTGFQVEDKGWAVALHADGAKPPEAEALLEAARAAARRLSGPTGFRIGEGPRFLEVAPAAADKAQSVEWFLSGDRPPNDLPVYFGDDAHDEAAFAGLRRRGGLPIGVGQRCALAGAVERLASPAEVRQWLEAIAAAAG